MALNKPTMLGMGKRSGGRGRLRMLWMDEIQARTKLPLAELIDATQDSRLGPMEGGGVRERWWNIKKYRPKKHLKLGKNNKFFCLYLSSSLDILEKSIEYFLNFNLTNYSLNWQEECQFHNFWINLIFRLLFEVVRDISSKVLVNTRIE